MVVGRSRETGVGVGRGGWGGEGQKWLWVEVERREWVWVEADGVDRARSVVGRRRGSGVCVGRGGWSGEGQGRWSVDVVVVAPRIVDLLAPHQTDENASVHHVHQLHTHGNTITSISISILIAVIITTNFLCSLFTKRQLPLYICNS